MSNMYIFLIFGGTDNFEMMSCPMLSAISSIIELVNIFS